MTKYIDADILRKEIEKRNLTNYCGTAEQYEEELFAIIDSLQQEQEKESLGSLITEAQKVVKHLTDMHSFYESLPEDIRYKHTEEGWRKILDAIASYKHQEQPCDVDSKLAERLEEISQKGLENAHSIDFTKQAENSKKILLKAKLPSDEHLDNWADLVTKLIDTFGEEHKDAIRHTAYEAYMLGREQTQPQLPSDVEEAAEKYRRDSFSKSLLPNIDGPMPEYGGSIKEAYKQGWLDRDAQVNLLANLDEKELLVEMTAYIDDWGFLCSDDSLRERTFCFLHKLEDDEGNLPEEVTVQIRKK